MAVLAVQHIRRMRGGAQGQLMLGADGHAYVVKFQNNPQHMRVLANEFLASKLAAAAGLTAPEVELIEVSKLADRKHAGAGDRPWPHARAMPAGTAVRIAICGRPDAGTGGRLSARRAIGRSEEPRGVCRASLRWTSGPGMQTARQAVFARKARERRYRAVFIDFGYCFHAGEWKFEDAPLRGVYFRNDVYREITGWESFEPWLIAARDDAGGDGVGSGERSSAGVVWRRSERDGSAGGEAAGATQPDSGVD